MNIEEFRKNAHDTVDWISDYFQNIEKFPVKSQASPGDVINRLPVRPPEEPESFATLMNDLDKLIIPGITHWQSPSFFAYFNANSSYPSILAEMITAALGTQCMSWQTSPAATELEDQMMNWIASLINLPDGFTGVIQDTASTATLCSLLTAREKFSGFSANNEGICKNQKFRIYCSSEAHSSIDKAVRIAGLGSDNLIKVGVDKHFSMDIEKLENAIKRDLTKGYKPLAVVAALGTTGTTSVDPIQKIGKICQRYGIWYHIDAAYAGTALMLDSNSKYKSGIDLADTFVFNPHKWMFTNFDCSAYYVRDRDALVRTFSILPEYLKTNEGDTVNNYRDWGIALGRRFRALKLWFVLRSYGVKGLKKKISDHVKWAEELGGDIVEHSDFELLAPVPFSTVCFRYHPEEINDEDLLNNLNNSLMEELNRSGELYLTHTKLNGRFTLRLVIGQTHQSRDHIVKAWKIINKTAENLKKRFIVN